MAKVINLATVLFCLILCIGMNGYAGETRPCADEIAKFCKDAKPGEGRIMRCLKEHENELSTGCKKNMEEAGKRLEACEQACCDDVKKFCKDVRQGSGRIAKCLREHANELSAPCKEKLEVK